MSPGFSGHNGFAERIHDVLGIGFGPSNLSLAIAIDEHNRSRTGEDVVDAVFVEKQDRFGWHRGMLIDDATMQVSFLKDLVTMRNPTSAYSFVSYLHDRGRLVDFMNHKTLFPLRIEFHDYLEWAARRMSHLVEYGDAVVDVRPVREDGEVWAFDVTIGEREPVVRRTRNVVIAAGLELRIPPGIEHSARVWHSRDLMRRISELADGSPRSRFVVIGAGQSAAEVTAYLHREFPETEVCAVFSRFGYSPADDSPFANRIFDPQAVDLFFGAPPAVKRMLMDYHRNTNYSVVDAELIQELYRRTYQEKVAGRERLRILHTCRVLGVRDGEGPVITTLESLTTGTRIELDSDAVVLATGYRPVCPLALLGQAASLCATGEDGMVRIERDYRAVMTCPMRSGIYLQGPTEHTHGIGSTLLSNTATRAGEILASILAERLRRRGESPVGVCEPA
jgi:L-ornithine N5-monooxygenase